MTSLNKICLHWTAGANKPCATDLNAYHFLIDSEGKVYEGKFKPEDNLNCYDGKYAAHCGGGNTGCIGIACCGMYSNKYPLTQKQVESMCSLVAKLCTKYGIQINEKNIFTHYEFGVLHPKSSSAGKIDFTTLSYLPTLQKERIGGYLRNKIQWYQIQQKKGL